MASRVMVLRGYGFNCEEETAAAYRAAGAEPVIVFASDWFAGKATLREFDMLHVPGGFSFGDDLGSGQVFANRLKQGKFPSGERVWTEVERFIADAGTIVGVCNGFQVLVRAGLLPNLGGSFAQEASLAANLSGHFEDRWVRCAPSGLGKQRFGANPFDLPVRHGEGRLVFGSPQIRAEVHERGLLGLRYVDAAGEPASAYPENPNGADDAGAGLFSADGRVFGLMPHPEAYLSPFNHPAWPSRVRAGTLKPDDESDGLRFVKALLSTKSAPRAAEASAQRT